MHIMIITHTALFCKSFSHVRAEIGFEDPFLTFNL